MRENYGNKRQPIMRILAAGLVILLICLEVCLFLVSVLRNSYRNEISADFQEHHVSTGEALDNSIDFGVEIVENAAVALGNVEYEYCDERIYSVLATYGAFQNMETLTYVPLSGCLYYEGRKYDKDYIGGSWQAFWEEMIDKSGTVVTLTPIGYDPTYRELLISVPVYYNNEFLGYMVGTQSLQNLFTEETYNYQNRMGECYLVSSLGIIISRSDDCVMIPNENIDFAESILEYSDKSEKSNREIQLLGNAFNLKKESGNVNIRTQEGDSLQISYYPLKSAEGLYFLSCYNDNLVDDKVQPLIYRSVLSCIIIIVLMITIIVYVWATAKRANITIEKLAYEDPVTKGKNINFFKEFAIGTMNVFKETPFVIYRFDIANFRYINEAYGHMRADEVLTSCIRNFDMTFGEKELCVRMNADQFLAIIENSSGVEKRLVQFRNAVNEEARSHGIKYPIRFKTGVYQIKKHDRDIDVMIDHANVARKTLNGDEKEMTAYYTERIVNDMRKVDRIESDMQRALATGEFRVYMQPKWDIYLNRVAGAEALVRWIKADGTMIYPDEFIPVFENDGFVEKLDFYMLETVCQRMEEMIEAGKKIYPVSVNQSRLLLHSPDYVTNIDRIIKKYHIPKNMIELEITETVFLDERDKMIETTNLLKECGVRLAMDDFGSGYSSLNMLKDIPFDIIKIDREFFSESVTSQHSQWILEKIIEMTSGLGMEVICEGVETKSQVLLLKTIGCRMVQGFFYSKPIPEEEFYEKYCESESYE